MKHDTQIQGEYTGGFVAMATTPLIFHYSEKLRVLLLCTKAALHGVETHDTPQTTFHGTVEQLTSTIHNLSHV